MKGIAGWSFDPDGVAGKSAKILSFPLISFHLSRAVGRYGGELRGFLGAELMVLAGRWEDLGLGRERPVSPLAGSWGPISRDVVHYGTCVRQGQQADVAALEMRRTMFGRGGWLPRVVSGEIR